MVLPPAHGVGSIKWHENTAWAAETRHEKGAPKGAFGVKTRV
jgi:hypothetical protein